MSQICRGEPKNSHFPYYYISNMSCFEVIPPVFPNVAKLGTCFETNISPFSQCGISYCIMYFFYCNGVQADHWLSSWHQ